MGMMLAIPLHGRNPAVNNGVQATISLNMWRSGCSDNVRFSNNKHL
jgi:hypothetical protein